MSAGEETAREERAPGPCASEVFFGFLALGLVARIAEYLHYRVLWQDEGYTGVTIATRSFAEFFQPLGLYQIVAPGYLVLAKLSITLGGVNEYAVRFPSLIAGMAALVLFAMAARRWLPGWGGVLGFTFFSSAGLLIYYSGECKPYAQDVLVATLLWWLAFDTVHTPVIEMRRILTLGIAGALAVWCSFPSCFVLAGIGAYQILRCLVARDFRALLRLMPAYLLWTASFAILFIVILYPGMHQDSDFRDESLMDTMQDSWSFGFLPFPPTNMGEVDLYFNQFLRLFWNPGGFRLTELAAFVWLVGWWSLWSTRRNLFWLLLNPFLFAFAVSLARLYPFDGRMILFLSPALFLVLGEGIAFFLRHLNAGRCVVAAILIALLLGPATARAARNIVAPPERFELNTALDVAQESWKEGDVLFLGFYDSLTFLYAKTWYTFPEEDVLVEEVPFERQDYTVPALERFPIDRVRGRRMWIPVWHHRALEGFLAELQQLGGTELEHHPLNGPELYLYQF